MTPFFVFFCCTCTLSVVHAQGLTALIDVKHFRDAYLSKDNGAVELPPIFNKGGLERAIPVGRGWRRIITTGMYSVQSGDILRIHAQVQVRSDQTVNDAVAYRGSLRILVDGNPIGTEQSQNVWDGDSNNANHHMPLWADAIYEHMKASRDINIDVEYAASRWNNPSNKFLRLEGLGYPSVCDCSELVIEHYRSYPDSQNLNNDPAARVLWGILGTQDEQTGLFVGRCNDCPFPGTVAYSLSLYPHMDQIRERDIIRLFGQSTSQYYDPPSNADQDQHAAGIKVSCTVDEFQALDRGENTGWKTSYVPLWSNATHKIISKDPGTQTYNLWMWAAGSLVVDKIYDGGHLYAMVYRDPNFASTKRSLNLATTFSAHPTNYKIKANQGNETIAQVPLSLSTGSYLRATGFTQIMQENSSDPPIACVAQLQLYKSVNGRFVLDSKSSFSSKNVHFDIETIPLRTELFRYIAETTEYHLKLQLNAQRIDKSPNIVVVGGRTKLLVEIWEPYE